MGVCILLRIYQLSSRHLRLQQTLVRVLFHAPYSRHVSALVSGQLQVISYNTVYSKDSYYIMLYYFNGSVEKILSFDLST
jgi:hypothetical protein